MPSSATSPVARSRASGTVGGRRLAKTIDSRSGARATSSRAISRTSGESSTRWKSSRIRTAPCSAIAGSSRRNTSMAASRVGPPTDMSPSIAAVVGAKPGIVLAAGGDEVVQEGDPVAVVIVEAIPERPQPGPPREVGEQRGLAVAGVREDQDDPVVDLGAQPVEQPVSRERVVAQRRALDLRRLDRVAGSRRRPVAPIGCCPDGGRPTWTDGDRLPRTAHLAGGATGEAARTIRIARRRCQRWIPDPGMRGDDADARSSAD